MRAIIALLALLPALAYAAEPLPAFLTRFLEADTLNAVMLPPGLATRLMEVEPEQQQAALPYSIGYRIQVFSDNNAGTARNEARRKEADVVAMFPEWRTYRQYNAPYWRVRVGDFTTRREADEAAERLREAFPAFSKEIRVVRDRINKTH